MLIAPKAVALPVSLYAQMVNPNWVMLEANTEMICPAQTILKPNIPPGSLLWLGLLASCLITEYIRTVEKLIKNELKEIGKFGYLSGSERVEIGIVVVIIFFFNVFQPTHKPVGSRGHQGFYPALEEVIGQYQG